MTRQQDITERILRHILNHPVVTFITVIFSTFVAGGGLMIKLLPFLIDNGIVPYEKNKNQITCSIPELATVSAESSKTIRALQADISSFQRRLTSELLLPKEKTSLIEQIDRLERQIDEERRSMIEIVSSLKPAC